jgi:pimeloyl-ACP methyl ester carboxylesterase
MSVASIKSVQCLSPAGLHKMAYKEWGDARNPRVLLCVHGVTRVADDFDQLAREMCDVYRVVCPDIVGRGRSDWLADPRHYQLPQYVSDIVTLIARLDVEHVDWLGTSMGGLIGMGLAAAANSPVQKLLLNDIGPALDAQALARIGAYIGQDLRFDTYQEAENYIKAISVSFGPHTDDEWRKIAADVLRQDADGRWHRHYDLKLAVPFQADAGADTKDAQARLWAAYDAIRCPTLVVRGERSDLLSHEVALQMTRRGPRARLVEFAGIGHAPTFVHADQIDVARDFFCPSE